MARLAKALTVTKPEQPLALDRPLETLIHVVRGMKVILDSDLAQLYGAETKLLNRAVKRHAERFPPEFMFQLTNEERLRCQIGTSNARRSSAGT